MKEAQPNNQPGQDVQFWQSFVQGDEEALGLLFRLHYRHLFRYGSKICADRVLLEDCIQELFLQLWQRKNPAPTISVKVYLLKALKYKLIKAMQQQNKKQLPDEPAFEISHEHFIINRQTDEEKVKKVVKALAMLTDRQKEIIYLKFYQNLSYDEVSGVMNITYQAARNLLHQAVKAMKKIMVQSYCLLFNFV